MGLQLHDAIGDSAIRDSAVYLLKYLQFSGHKRSLKTVIWQRELYTSGHFIEIIMKFEILMKLAEVCFIKFIWNNSFCKILFLFGLLLHQQARSTFLAYPTLISMSLNCARKCRLTPGDVRRYFLAQSCITSGCHFDTMTSVLISTS